MAVVLDHHQTLPSSPSLLPVDPAIYPLRTSLYTATSGSRVLDQSSSSPPRPPLFQPTHRPSRRTDSIGDAGFYGSDDKKTMNVSGTDFGDIGRTYRITPIQQPERSSSFQGQYLSRIPLAPPLILQLDCWDANGDITIPHDELPFLVCHLTLLTPEGEDATMVTSPEPALKGQTVALLYGTLIASPVEMTDVTSATGVYFCFPDVSIRYDGRWKLKASLMRITGGSALDTAETEPFDIVPNRTYTAPPVTELTQHFHAQGLVNFGL